MGKAQLYLNLQAHLVLGITAEESYRLLINFKWSAFECEADLSPFRRSRTDSRKPQTVPQRMLSNGQVTFLGIPAFVLIGVSAAGLPKRSC